MMKPSVYFFGTLPKGFASYPQDHTKVILKDFIAKSRNDCQIVIHRDGNLIYYGYVRRLSGGDCLGICVCLDCIYNNIESLFRIFDDIYVWMVKVGGIIGIKGNEEIKWATSNFSSDAVKVELVEYSHQLVEAVALSERNTQPLPPLDFSIPADYCFELSLKDGKPKIIDATKRYSNVYIVKTQAEIAKLNSFYSILKGKENEVEELKSIIADQQAKNKELNARIKKRGGKRKRKWIVRTLILLLMVLGVWIFVSQRDLHSVQRCNENASEEITHLGDSIRNLNGTIENLNPSFVIYNLSVGRSGVTFNYKTSEERNIELTLKAIRIGSKGDIITRVHTETYYVGDGQKTLEFDHNLNVGDEYYVFLMRDGKIIAGKKWWLENSNKNSYRHGGGISEE